MEKPPLSVKLFHPAEGDGEYYTMKYYPWETLSELIQLALIVQASELETTWRKECTLSPEIEPQLVGYTWHVDVKKNYVLAMPVFVVDDGSLYVQYRSDNGSFTGFPITAEKVKFILT